MTDKTVSQYASRLEGLAIGHEVLEHPPLTSIQEVQNYLGFGLDESLATLIMKTEKGYVAVLRRGDCRLDNKKVKKALGVQDLRMADDKEFADLTGVVPGAAHVLHPVSRVLIDRRVFEKEFINGGSGSLSYTFRYRSADLAKIPNSAVAELAETSVYTDATTGGRKRVFSGIRATGRLHLGNYLGAVKGMIQLQDSNQYETVYCVVDVHSITTPFDVEALRRNKREIIIDYLAAGLDPKKSILIYQSDVPEHTELSFYFSSIMSVARMQHLPTFKEKVKQYPQNVTMALLNYPILMAADILVYKASLVPVGIDQEPHLEVAREIARKMNQEYGTEFPEPVRFATEGEYIPSLKGEGKMSKSIEGSYINLTDTHEEIKKKVRAIPTATVAGGEMNQGVKALFTFAKLYLPGKLAQYKKEFDEGTLKFVTLKDEIAEAIYKELKPFQERRDKIARDPSYVDAVIREGAQKARALAQETLGEVKRKMGLS